MSKIGVPAALFARAAERAQVAKETAAAEAVRIPIKTVLFQWAGAKPVAGLSKPQLA
jgi:hypothetical protein